MDQLERKIVFGKHPVMELLTSNHPVEKVFVLQSLKGMVEIQIRSICNDKNIPLIKTKQESLNKLSGGRKHQGFVAISSPIAFKELENLIPFLFENGMNPAFLILDHITDTRNFGAIIRSAEIFGVHGIIIPKKGSAAITNDTLKASSGAIFRMNICRVSNLADALRLLKASGLRIFSADSNATESIQNMSFSDPLAIIVGSEGKGVQKELHMLADYSFQIPQTGKTASLNVSVATGIALYVMQNKRISNN